MTTKLEIIGPYTPEHEGPFCLGDGRPVRLITKTEGSKKFPVVGYIGDAILPMSWSSHGYNDNRHTRHVHDSTQDLMNAREVRVPREFWVVDYGSGKTQIHNSLGGAVMEKTERATIIHVREVLEREG